MANGFPVKANYATGDILTATNMNELSATLNYLQYMPPRNPVLNSNFSVWQRGTSGAGGTGATSGFVADRWQGLRNGYAAGMTVSRQATGDTTNLPNIQYCARVQRDSGNTSTGAIIYFQNFESVNSIPFAGKTVTLSFYARAGANFSSAASALPVSLITGTGTDQNTVTTGFTGQVTAIGQTATLTTTWQRFTYSATLASNISQIAIQYTVTPVGTAGANDYFEITGVQLELGSVANTYMPNQPTYQGELAACQRYYFRQIAAEAYSSFAFGMAGSTTSAKILVNLPVTMRTKPASLDYSTLMLWDVNSNAAISALSLSESNTTSTNVTATSTGLTANRPYFILANNSTSAYLGFSAEL